MAMSEDGSTELCTRYENVLPTPLCHV